MLADDAAVGGILESSYFIVYGSCLCMLLNANCRLVALLSRVSN